LSVQDFNEVATSFLKSNALQVLAVKGSWGAGKTHAWNALIKSVGPSMWPQTYSYVSLFGLASIDEVRTAIVAGIQPAELLGNNGLTTEVINSKWAELITAKVGSGLARFRRLLGDYELGKHINVALNVVAPWVVKDMVICFDDFERTGAELTHDQIMGLISTLQNESGCKVVLILNEDKISDEQKIGGTSFYALYREKVVDLEITFAPTVDEALEWGIDSDLPFRTRAADIAKKLEIRNVRVLRRINKATRLITDCIASLGDEVLQSAVATAVLLGWVHFERSGQAPTIDFIRNWQSMRYYLDKEAKKKASEEELRWTKALEGIGYMEFDEFDDAILKVIQQGYVRGSGLEDVAAKRAEQHDRQAKVNAFQEAWSKFHDSYQIDEIEVVESLDKATRSAVLILNPTDLSAVCGLFRQLGLDKKADSLIKLYVDIRKDNPALFDIPNAPFGELIKDEQLRKAFAEQLTRIVPTVSLRDAIEAIANKKAWDKPEQRALESATADDYYAVFKGPLSIRGRRAIDTCLEVAPVMQGEIRSRVLEAANRIRGESRIQAIRLADLPPN